MKQTLFIMLLSMTLVSCTTHTKYGACIGLVDRQDPKLRYEVSWWNVFLGISLSETIIVPVYILAKDIQCPEGEYK